MNQRTWGAICVFSLIEAVCLIGQARADSNMDLFLEVLGGAAQGNAMGEKFKECVGGNRDNWARCDREMRESQNQYSEQVQRRTTERERRDRIREEREAMAECEREQDPDRYMRCVRSLSR